MQRSVTTSAPLPLGSRLRRLLVALLVIANVAVFAMLFYLNGIKEAVVESIETIPPEQLTALVAPSGSSSDPIFILLVGSDTRDTLTDDLEGEFGYFEGQRADVIMLFRVDPGEGTAQLVSLPRDLLVERPGGGVEKLNAAYSRDTNSVIDAVSDVTGVPINHYVEVDFVGFANIVDELGGLDYYFPLPSRDLKSGLLVDAGTIHMNGATALAFARSRTLEEFVNGEWRGVPGSDLERTKRQQSLIFAILNEAKRPSRWLDMGELVSSIGEEIRTDSGLDFETLRELAWNMRSFKSEELEAVTLPVDFTLRGGISYVVERQPDAEQVLAALRSGQPLTNSPLSLRIEVRNANGRNGAGTDFAQFLESLGHVVAAVGNAESSDYQETIVIARPGQISTADSFVAQIGFGTVQDGNLTSSGVDLVVYLGADAVDFGDAAS